MIAMTIDTTEPPWRLLPAVAWIIAGLVVYYVTTAFLSWHRMRHIPGPLLASFSYLWLGWVQTSGRMSFIYRDLPKKYHGVSLVRVGPNVVTTDDPEVIRRMNAARSPYVRDRWYRAGRWHPTEHHMFNELDPHRHDAMKARTVSAYAGKETEALERGIRDQVLGLVGLIRGKYISSVSKRQEPRLFDMALLCAYLTLDVITKAGTGEAFGHVRTESDVSGFLTEARRMYRFMGLTLDVPWFRDIVYSGPVLRLLGPKKTDETGVGRLMRIADDIVSQRMRSGAPEQKDMLGSFIRNGMSRGEVETEVMFMIAAGSDTTASVMKITLLNLLANPVAYRSLKREIARAVRETGMASRPVLFEEARGLEYLQAVIYEGMRMRPPSPLLFLKVVPPEGDVIDGKFVSGGTAVGMNTSALLNSKKLFGEDADLFRPERFTKASSVGKREEMQRNVELIFGYGRYMCVGKPIVWIELNLFFFELFRHFDLQLANPQKPWDTQSWQIWADENFWMKATESDIDDWL